MRAGQPGECPPHPRARGQAQALFSECRVAPLPSLWGSPAGWRTGWVGPGGGGAGEGQGKVKGCALRCSQSGPISEAEMGVVLLCLPCPRVADRLPGHGPWQAICFPFLGDSLKTDAHFLFKDQGDNRNVREILSGAHTTNKLPSAGLPGMPGREGGRAGGCQGSCAPGWVTGRAHPGMGPETPPTFPCFPRGSQPGRCTHFSASPSSSVPARQTDWCLGSQHGWSG